MLPGGRFEPVPGEPGVRNIVGTLPGTKPGDRDRRALRHARQAEGLRRREQRRRRHGDRRSRSRARSPGPTSRPARAQVRFVLFDGEEPAAGLPEESRDFYHSGLRGSRAYVKAHPGETADMVLLDYVGNKGLKLPREGSSSIALWSRLRSAAAPRRRGARLPGLLERRHRRRPLALPPSRRPRRRPDRLALPRPRRSATASTSSRRRASTRSGRRSSSSPRASACRTRSASASRPVTARPLDA